MNGSSTHSSNGSAVQYGSTRLVKVVRELANEAEAHQVNDCIVDDDVLDTLEDLENLNDVLQNDPESYNLSPSTHQCPVYYQPPAVSLDKHQNQVSESYITGEFKTAVETQDASK